MKTDTRPQNDQTGTTGDDLVDEKSADTTAEVADLKTADEKSDKKDDSKSRLAGRSVSLRSVVVGAVAVLVVAALGLMGWQLLSAKNEVGDLQAASADRARAEQVALDYAQGAANMSFENPEDWRSRLTKGTSPELSERLRQASTQMEQLLRPLQWSSTAEPIAAKVESVDGDSYQVVAFVNVRTKNVQAPSGIESTATYRMTLDKSQDWLITAISSTGSNLDANEGAAAPEAGQAPAPGQPAPAQQAPGQPAPAVPGN
ncbi:hypothetical protein [Gordonia rubripertincta]|uniref:hypothetical protein n=1 Tax=Gordonia rubripertincta TaxID=36822 RepID=UPI0021B0F9D2|nr:hypothetical protein [Gordonia rubripertincta]